jgi:putative N6-adenine-specific DNA methylase
MEPFASQELQQLGLRIHPPELAATGHEVGGFEFEGGLADVYRANLNLRTISRILIRLGSFYAVGFPELRRKTSHLAWENHLKVGQPVALRVTCHKSRLYHQQAVAERVAGGISDRLKQPVEVERHREDSSTKPPQLIFVRLLENRCTISIDSSGDLLHRRGYRLAVAKAPLRETLAAALLLASGWDRTSPLLDPFCGSGTIVIEAGLMARQIPPGSMRHFAFMDWPGFDRRLWEEVLSQGLSSRRESSPTIIASDRDAGAIQSAKSNAERARVADCIEFSRRSLSAISPPSGPGWVVTNPPYGVRTKTDQDLRNLYAQLGKVLREKCPGWKIAMLCGSEKLIHQTGFSLDKGITVLNGAIRVRFMRGMIGRP